jgi:protease I
MELKACRQTLSDMAFPEDDMDNATPDNPQLLAGKRIAVLAADGVEQVELETPVAALKAAGAEVAVVALRAGRIRAMHVHQSADLLRVDKIIGKARAADYDALLVPGGYIGPDLLRQSAPARDFLRHIHALGKPIALMSQAPLLLVSCGLAGGRTLTAWPGVRDDIVNAGAIWRNQAVLRDGNILSSRGPQDTAALVQALLPFFAGTPAAVAAMDAGASAGSEADAGPAARSDPAQEEPSETPGQPLRWLSAPSVGAMLSLALLGMGVVAANRGLRRKRADEAEPGTASAGDTAT